MSNNEKVLESFNAAVDEFKQRKLSEDELEQKRQQRQHHIIEADRLHDEINAAVDWRMQASPKLDDLIGMIKEAAGYDGK